MFKKMSLILVFCFYSLSGFGANCENYFPENDLCYDLEWIEGPHAYSESQFKIKFWKESSHGSHVLITPENLEIRLWMPSMNHGSRPVSLEENGIGKFYVTNVFFIMGGDWEVQMKINDEIHAIELEL